MASPQANSNASSSSHLTENATQSSQPLENEDENHPSAPSSTKSVNAGQPTNKSFFLQSDKTSSGPNLNSDLISTDIHSPKADEPSRPARPSTALSNIGNVLRTGSSRTSRRRDPALRPRSRLANPSTLWYGGDAARAARRLGLDWIWPNSGHPEVPSQNQYSSADLLGEEQPSNPADQTATNTPHDDPPDGGAMAWAHVVAGFIVCLNTQGLNLCFGVFNAYYTHIMFPERTRSEIAWVGSIQIFATFFCVLIGNPLYNMGYFKLCFRGGSIGLFASLLWTSFCKTFGQVLGVQGILMGISMGLVFSSGVLVLSTYFSERTGSAMAVASVGTSVGGILFPLVFNYSIENIGFGWTVRIFALINLVTMLPANIIARERPRVARPGSVFFDRTILTDYGYLFMLAGMFFAFWGAYFGFYFIALFGLDVLHLPTQQSLNLLVAMNAANFFGRLPSGFIADKCIGPMQTLVPLTILSAILMFMWLVVEKQATLFFVGCFYGLAVGGVQTLFASCTRSFPSPSGGANNTNRLALVFIAISIATLTGAPLGGKLIEVHDGNYLYAQIFTGTTLAVAAVLFLVARYLKQGWRRARF